MSDNDQLKKELAGIEEFLKNFSDSPTASQLRTRKREIEAQLIGRVRLRWRRRDRHRSGWN